MDIRQSPKDSVVVKRQAFMVDAQQVQSRGMKVMHARRASGDFVTELVRRAVGKTMLQPSTRQPDRERRLIVITPFPKSSGF